jgi:SAM-dependent methyltransferase
MIFNDASTCPLCSIPGPFMRILGPLRLAYQYCAYCHLIFMEREFLPEPKLEKQHYQTHQNGPQYPGYVRFLEQAIIPTLPYLNSKMRGLDYGCGPDPTISVLLANKGLGCDNFDPFFFPNLPEKPLDFIFVTEVLEHFHNPDQELNRIRNLLKPGGILTIMTELWNDLDDFAEWYYAKDFTHVSFYHARTIDFICSKFGFVIVNRENPRVSVLKKL